MIRILIVDDSVFSQKTTAYLLKKTLPDEEMELSFASDGEEGLAKFRELKPDYMLIDLLMPKLGGAELAQIVLKEGGTGVIILTADVQKRVREEFENQKVLAFVNKPLNDEKMRLLCDLMMRNDCHESGKLSV